MRTLEAVAVSLAVWALSAVSPAVAQDKKKIDAGEAIYNDYCQTCHGTDLVNIGQSSYDLRRLKPTDRERFGTSVQKGKGNMPPWKGVIDDDQMEAIWVYIMSKAPPG